MSDDREFRTDKLPRNRKVAGERRKPTTRKRNIEAARKRGRVDGRAICGAPTRTGTLCQRTPGAGTDHIGVGRCDKHGGNTPDGIKDTAVQIATHLRTSALLDDMPVMGMPVQMDPAEALSQCIAIAAGEVAYFTHRIRTLTHDDVVVRSRSSKREYGEGEKGYKDVRTVEVSSEESLHVLITERQRAVDRLARLSKMALDAGVAERQVALAERQGELFAAAIRQVMEAVGLTAKQTAKLRQALPPVLLQLQSPEGVTA